MLVVVIAVGVLRIALTYDVFFQTCDEPYHLACGMGWLDLGRSGDLEHPPLAHVAGALGPYLAGLRSSGLAHMDSEGNAILRSRGSFERNLTLARVGMLPFYVLACLVVWLWTRRLFGEPTALAATFLFSFLPPILGHSGVVTTDMAITACLPAALLSFEVWREKPGALQSLLLGSAIGLAVLSKFSTILFLPACVLGITTLWWVEKRPTWTSVRRSLRAHTLPAVLSAAIALVVVWAGYRFALTPLTTAEHRPHSTGFSSVDRVLERDGRVREVAYRWMETPLPAGEMILGLLKVRVHNRHGHPSFLLGEFGEHGWWYFFPVVLGVKTPLAFFLLVIAGIVLLWNDPDGRRSSKKWSPVVCAVAVLLVVLPSRINIGVRHVLPIYPFLAVIAGFGVTALVERGRTNRLNLAVACGLLLWFVASSATAHPDYLAYFNELAGGHPERIVIDSDLDWGQDLWRLSRALKELGVERVALEYFGSEDILDQGLPEILPLPPYRPVAGWIAISEFSLTVGAEEIRKTAHRDDPPYAWLAGRPFTRVGKSIRLYHILEPDRAPAQ